MFRLPRLSIAGVTLALAAGVSALAGEPPKAPAGMVWIPGGEFKMGAVVNGHGSHEMPMASNDAEPIHPVRVDGFWMDKTVVTNAEFEKFVTATSYVTIAERKPTQEEYPDAPPENLIAGSVVFTPPDHEVPLNNHFQWWDYIKGANWRHPTGPESNIEGKGNYPVVQIGYPDAEAYAKWAGNPGLTQFTWSLPVGAVLDSAPIVSPIGRRIAFTAVSGDSAPRLFVRSLDSLDATAINGTDGAKQPFWSPDGTSLGFFALGKLMKVAVAGGVPVVICDARDGKGGAWSPTGTIVFGPDIIFEGLAKVSADGGPVQPATLVDFDRDENSHRWPVFLPDGIHFLYYVRASIDERRGVYVGRIDQPASKPSSPLFRSESEAIFVATSGRERGVLLSRQPTASCRHGPSTRRRSVLSVIHARCRWPRARTRRTSPAMLSGSPISSPLWQCRWRTACGWRPSRAMGRTCACPSASHRAGRAYPRTGGG